MKKPEGWAITNSLRYDLVCRKHNYVLQNFYIGNWECDVFSVTKSDLTNEFEVKTTVADYKNDFTKGYANINKHDFIKEGKRTNKFWFVVPENLITEVPEYAGLIYARQYSDDGFSFYKVKEAPLLHKDRLKDRVPLIRNIARKCYNRMNDIWLSNRIKYSE